jgi:tetratricopeptide (TPR) repeat protein
MAGVPRASFYALALLSTAPPTDKTHANQKKAASILEPFYAQNPEHPGIAHYLIHSCDNSEMAQQGVKAADEYAKIAPSAPHALHMPSHIYTRLGVWNESVESSQAARRAAQQHGDVGEELHAMDYLTYADLQLGRDEGAAAVVADLQQMREVQGASFKVGYAATAMPVQLAVERGEWQEAAALNPAAGDSMEKLPLKPGPLVPAREQLGELLLQMNQPSDALQQFEAALQQSSGRRNALLGAKTAAELSKNKQKSELCAAELQKLPQRGVLLVQARTLLTIPSFFCASGRAKALVGLWLFIVRTCL